MTGHPWTCVCDACLAEDVQDAKESAKRGQRMPERLGELAAETLRLRALLRDAADAADRIAAPVDPEAGSPLAEVLDVVRAAALQDTGSNAYGKSLPRDTERIAAWVAGCGLWAKGLADGIIEGRWRS
jgi:hypothetical protein